MTCGFFFSAYRHFNCSLTSYWDGRVFFIVQTPQFNHVFQFIQMLRNAVLCCVAIKYCNKIYDHFDLLPVIDRHIYVFYWKKACNLFGNRFRKLSKHQFIIGFSALKRENGS